MSDWPVSVIPNTLPCDVYKPSPKSVARSAFNLPEGVPLILYGAMGGGNNPGKGWDLLREALLLVSEAVAGCECVVFGQSAPRDPVSVNMPVHYTGHLHDDQSLAMLYSAADVLVVPSRMEAFGQTASESMACETPVVAFDATGLKDVVVHGETGYLARPYDAESLAEGMCWVLRDQERRRELGLACRRRALSRWAYDVVVPQYIAVYRSAIMAAS